MSYTYISVTSCFVTAIVLLVFTVIAVFLRLILSWRRSKKMASFMLSQHLDDIFCFLALVPAIGLSVVLIYGSAKGVVGAHNDASNIENWITSTTPTLVILEKLVYIMFILQPLAIGFTKLAFLFFYRRIFTWPSFQKVSLGFIFLTVGFIIAFFFGFVFDCNLNFSANWGSLASIAENCPFGFEASIAFTVIDAFFDLCILLLPLPWIWRLQMPTVRKFQVCGVFLLGGFAVAAAIVRMVICIKQNTPQEGLEMVTIMGMPPYDIIGITSHGIFWTIVETNIALIACCLPALRPIFKVATFGSVLSSLGSMLQIAGSKLGSQNASQATGNSSGKFSKISVASATTSRPSGKGQYERAVVSRAESDISLVEVHKKGEVHITPDPYAVFDMESEDRTYNNNAPRSLRGNDMV